MIGTDTRLNRFRCRLLGHVFYITSARQTSVPRPGVHALSECRRCAKIQSMLIPDELIVDPSSDPPSDSVSNPGIID